MTVGLYLYGAFPFFQCLQKTKKKKKRTKQSVKLVKQYGGIDNQNTNKRKLTG